MDRRTLLAISLSFLIFVLWQKFYLEPRMPQPGSPSQGLVFQQETPGYYYQDVPPSQAVTQRQALEAQRPERVSATQTIDVSVRSGNVSLGNSIAALEDWSLKGYTQQDRDAFVDLESTLHVPSTLRIAFDRQEYAYLSQVIGDLSQQDGQVIWNYEDENLSLTRKIYHAEGQSYLQMVWEGQFKGENVPRHAFVSMQARGIPGGRDAREQRFEFWQPQHKEVGQVELVDKIPQLLSIEAPVQWIAAKNRYFALAVVNESPSAASGLVQQTGPNEGQLSMVYPLYGNRFSIPTRVYFGPKELDTLQAVAPSLEQAVDYGFLSVLALPILRFMNWIFQYVHNYGFAIIIMTIILKIVTYPLTYKSMKSMREMAKIQPELLKLKNKHKDDREALNREMMTLMKTKGYNPLAGCFPILIQMPIFIALFRVLDVSVELYQAPFMFWIQDLSARDPFFITPALLTITMFLQQKIMPTTATDPMQKKVMQMMPIIFGAFMLTLPAGLTVYMLTNTVVSIAQMFYLNKKLDIQHAPAVTVKAKA
jgi:YidC/Oxa1 family membrane protein insertase